VTNFQGEGAI